jgi:hypothetical protein
MTRTLSARAGSCVAGLGLAYVAALLAVTNLIFSADVTASTRLPGNVVRTGTYALSVAAAPQAAEPAPAPVVATPALSPSAVSRAGAAPTAAGETQAGSSDPATTTRREASRRPAASVLSAQSGQFNRDEPPAK